MSNGFKRPRIVERNVEHRNHTFQCECGQKELVLYWNMGELDVNTCSNCGRRYSLEIKRVDLVVEEPKS